MWLSLHKWRLDPDKILKKDNKLRRETIETTMVVVSTGGCKEYAECRRAAETKSEPLILTSFLPELRESRPASVSYFLLQHKYNRETKGWGVMHVVWCGCIKHSENDLLTVSKCLVLFCLPGWSHQTLTISRLLAKEALERSRFNSYTFVLFLFPSI